MKVGSLFAEIGFKVDKRGLEQFSNAISAFQKTIRSGLKDLKQYANAAKEISKAMREAYVPSQKEMSSRYRAQTAYMRSQSRTGNAWEKVRKAEAKSLLAQANLANTRAALLPEQTRIRASNARSRERQLDLKEKGLIGTHNGRASKFLGRAVSIVGGLASGSITTVLGGLFGPFGAVLGKLVDTIVSAIWKATTWLGRTILSGIRLGMEYRDYRNFTGRSTTGLGRLMAGTLNTSNMSPEEVLKDAARLETDYWAMILGEGNPALWQLLGISPTGTGEIDLQNLVNQIGRITGGFQNRGLARYLFKKAGLSEDYLNIALYNAKNGGTDLTEEVNRLLENAEDYEDANIALRKFSRELDVFRAELAEKFIQSPAFDKLKEILNMLLEKLPQILDIFGQLFEVISNFIEWARTEFPNIFGSNKTEVEQTEDRWSRAIKKGENPFLFGIKEAFMHPWDTAVTAGYGTFDWLKDALSNQYMSNLAMASMNNGILMPYDFGGGSRNVSISNSFNVQSAEEAVRIERGVQDNAEKLFDGDVDIQIQQNNGYLQSTKW